MEAQTRRTTGTIGAIANRMFGCSISLEATSTGFFNSGFTALEVAEGKAGQRNHNDADQTHGDGWS